MDEKLVDQAPSVLHHEELLARCMGNVEFAERVLDRFQQSFGADLAELEKGLDSENAEQVSSVAHRLKGASANVSAPGLCQWASEIEQLGRAARLSEIPTHLERLRCEWSRFVGVVSSPTVWTDTEL